MTPKRHRWIRPFVLLALGVFFVLVGGLGYLVISDTGAERALRGPPDIWFEDTRDTVVLGDEDASRLLIAVRSALSGPDDGEVDLTGIPTGPATPHIVFLSASDGETQAWIAMGSGNGFPAALRNAVGALRGLGVNEAGARWLRLDIVKGHDGLPLYFPRDGAAFARESGLALLMPELAAYRASDRDGGVRVAHLPRRLQLRLVAPWRVALGELSVTQREVLDRLAIAIPFATESFFWADGESVRLIGTQRPRNPGDPETLVQAARDAGAYLQRMTQPDGRFVYSYLPGSDSEGGGYNLLRHAGTAYAMLELYALTRDRGLVADAERAIGHLLGHVRDHPATREMAVLVSEDSVKLGGVALAIVALAKHAEVTGDRRHVPRMQALARYLQDSQAEDGSFVSQRFWPSLDARTDFESQYYPGEAILALMRLYALDPQTGWLDTAERAARYLITVRDKGVAEIQLPHDHWLLYALNELHRARPDRLYVDHARRIAGAIVASQNRNPIPPEYQGAFAGRVESTPTAARAEGLVAAYALLRDFGGGEDLAWLRSAIELGVGFQLQAQLLPERAMYLPNPRRALGGFSRSVTDYEIQIDTVQHNLSAVLGLYRMLHATDTSPKSADR